MNLMTSKADLETALKDAMRSGDEVRKSTIRMALSNIKLAEVNSGKAMDEAAVQAQLFKEVKARRETIADAERAHRPDLVTAAQGEIAVLETFLPPQFTPEELEALARQAIAETEATSVKDMGRVMKALQPRLEGRASSDQAGQVVRRLLQ
jgi:uncharacterized protein YqeY